MLLIKIDKSYQIDNICLKLFYKLHIHFLNNLSQICYFIFKNLNFYN